MAREGWSAPGVTPFFSARARVRAPVILEHAAIGGGALLIGPNGEVVMASRGAVRMESPGARYHVQEVIDGWAICAIELPSANVEESELVERLRKASKVMRLALIDREPGGSSGDGIPPSGAPAEVALPLRAR